MKFLQALKKISIKISSSAGKRVETILNQYQKDCIANVNCQESYYGALLVEEIIDSFRKKEVRLLNLRESVILIPQNDKNKLPIIKIYFAEIYGFVATLLIYLDTNEGLLVNFQKSSEFVSDEHAVREIELT